MSELGEQPVWGAVAISEIINRSRHQTFYMLSHGMLPAKRVGGRWCAFPSRLRQCLAESPSPAPHKEKAQ